MSNGGTNAGRIRAARAYVELLVDNNQLSRGLKRAEFEIKAFASKLSSIGSQLFGMGMVGALPIGLSVKHFAELDDSLRTVKGVTGATGKEFDKLSEKARFLGRTTSFTSKQVSEAMVELGRAGFKTDQIDQMIDHVMNLSRATRTEIPVAAEIASNTIRQFGLDCSETGRVVDVLTATSNSSAQTLEDLAVSFRYVAPVAKEFNMSVEDTATIVGTLANQGLRGEMAGTAFRNILARMGSPEVQGKFKELGVSLRNEATGAVRTFGEIMTDVGKAMEEKGMDPLEKAGWFHKAFGLRSMAGGSKLVSAQFEELSNAINNCKDAAAKTAMEMDAGLGGTIRLVTSAVQGLMEAIGEALTGDLKNFGKVAMDTVNSWTDWLRVNQEVVVSVTKTIVEMTALGAALFAAGAALTTFAVTLGGVSSAIGLFVSVLGSTGIVAHSFSWTLGRIVGSIASVAGGIGPLVAGIALLGSTLVSWGTLKTSLFGNAADKLGEISHEMETLGETTKRVQEEDNKLLKKLEDINGATKKTPEMMDEMQNIVSELNGKYQGLGLSVDSVTQSVLGLADAHKKLSDAQRQATIDMDKRVLAEVENNIAINQGKKDARIKEAFGSNWNPFKDARLPLLFQDVTGLYAQYGDKLFNEDLHIMSHVNAYRDEFIKYEDKETGKVYAVSKDNLGAGYHGMTGQKFVDELNSYNQAIDEGNQKKFQIEGRINTNEAGGVGNSAPGDLPTNTVPSNTWAPEGLERKTPEQLIAEWSKSSGNGTESDVRSAFMYQSLANEELDNQIAEQSKEVERTRGLSGALNSSSALSNTFTGKLGVFADQKGVNKYNRLNLNEFKTNAKEWENSFIISAEGETDDAKKSYWNSLAEQTRLFSEEFVKYISEGGDADKFDMSKYSNLFGAMNNAELDTILKAEEQKYDVEKQKIESRFVERTNDAGLRVWTEQDENGKWTGPDMTVEEKNKLVTDRQNELFTNMKNKTSGLRNAMDYNAAYTNLGQTKEKKAKLAELIKQKIASIQGDDLKRKEYEDFLKRMEEGSMTDTDKAVAKAMNEAEKQKQWIAEQVALGKKYEGYNTVTVNGVETKVDDWDKWSQDQNALIDKLFEDQKRQIRESSDVYKTVADMFGNYEDPNISDFEKKIDELNKKRNDELKAVQQKHNMAVSTNASAVELDGKMYSPEEWKKEADKKVNQQYDSLIENFKKDEREKADKERDAFSELGKKTKRTDLNNTLHDLKEEYKDEVKKIKANRKQGLITPEEEKQQLATALRSHRQRVADAKKKDAAQKKSSKEFKLDEKADAWDTNTTVYDQKLADINSQLSEAQIDRQRSMNNGDFGRANFMGGVISNLEYSKSQIEFERAVAWSKEIGIRLKEAKKERQDAAKAENDLGNNASDEEKKAARERVNNAINNESKIMSSSEAVQNALKNMIENQNRLEKNAGNFTEQNLRYEQILSARGSFDPFEISGGMGRSSWFDEIKDQTSILEDIRDNTQTMSQVDGAWM